MAFDWLKYGAIDLIKLRGDRKNIQSTVESKFDAYNLLRSYFQIQHKAGKSVLTPDGKGGWTFTPETEYVYNMVMDKLLVMDGSEIDSFKFKDPTALKGHAIKQGIENFRIDLEAKRIKHIMKKVVDEQDKFGLSAMDDDALVQQMNDQRMWNRRGLKSNNHSTTRGYMKDNQTSALRGLLLRKSGFKEDLDSMSDEEIIKSYESYRRELIRIGRTSDIIKSQLISDPNYQAYLKAQDRMTLRTRLQIAKVNIGKGIKKICNTPVVRSIGSFFSNNKMLNIINGYDKIPDEYVNKAVGNLLEAFEKAEKEASANQSLTADEARQTAPVREATPETPTTSPDTTPPARESAPEGTPPASPEAPATPEVPNGTPPAEETTLDESKSFVRKGKDGEYQKVYYEIDNTDNNKITIKPVEVKEVSLESLSDNEKQQLISGTADIVLGDDKNVSCVVDDVITKETNSLLKTEDFVKQKEFGEIMGVKGTPENSEILQSIASYDGCVGNGTKEQQEVNAIIRDEAIREYEEYIASNDELSFKKINDTFRKNRKEYEKFAKTEDRSYSDTKHQKFGFYYKKQQETRPTLTPVSSEKFEEAKTTLKQKPKRIYVNASESSAHYHEYIEKDGQFILSSTLLEETDIKKINPKIKEEIENGKKSGEMTLDGKPPVVFVSGRNSNGELTYQPLEEFKMSTTYLASAILGNEFKEFMEKDENKNLDVISARRKFVQENQAVCDRVVKNYRTYYSSEEHQKTAEEVIKSFKKDYKQFSSVHTDLDKEALDYAFARDHIRKFNESNIKNIVKNHEKGSFGLLNVDDSKVPDDNPKKKPLVINGQKFECRGFCTVMNEEGKAEDRLFYESKKAPGLFVFGGEREKIDEGIRNIPEDEPSQGFEGYIPGQKMVHFEYMDPKTGEVISQTYVAQEGIFGEQNFISKEEFEKIQQAEAENIIENIVESPAPEPVREDGMDRGRTAEPEGMYNFDPFNPPEAEIEEITVVEEVETPTSPVKPRPTLPEGTPVIEQPEGISDLARDALWEDIYQTIVVDKPDASGNRRFRDKNGNPKIGRLTEMLIGIASDNVKDLLPEDKKDANKKVKDVLTTTYKNHAIKAIIDLANGSSENIDKLYAELDVLGLGDLKASFEGKTPDEIKASAEAIADGIAKGKTNYYLDFGFSDRGLARHALFELSQARYNVETGEQSAVKESRFYRALRDANMEFDIGKYETLIRDKVGEQVIDSLGEGTNKDETQVIDANGEIIDVYSVEINGVKCYVSKEDGKIIETEEIIQNEKPLVDKNEIANEVSQERENNRQIFRNSTQDERYRGQENVHKLEYQSSEGMSR